MKKREPRRWFRFYVGMLDDPVVQRLPPDAFRTAFVGALDGRDSPFSRWMRAGRDRMNGPVWMALRRFIFARDDYTCTYCGVRSVRLECDHIVPVSRGGSHRKSNLTTACRPCNRSKRDKLLKEWMS